MRGAEPFTSAMNMAAPTVWTFGDYPQVAGPPRALRKPDTLDDRDARRLGRLGTVNFAVNPPRRGEGIEIGGGVTNEPTTDLVVSWADPGTTPACQRFGCQGEPCGGGVFV